MLRSNIKFDYDGLDSVNVSSDARQWYHYCKTRWADYTEVDIEEDSLNGEETLERDM